MSRIRIYGVEIDNVTQKEAVARALEAGSVNVVFTPNALMLDACRRDGELVSLLNRASLSLPDGMGVVWAARRGGVPLKARVAGIEFGEALLERAAREGLRVFLLGGKAGVRRAPPRRCVRDTRDFAFAAPTGAILTARERITGGCSRISARVAQIFCWCAWGFPCRSNGLRKISARLPGCALWRGLAAVLTCGRGTYTVRRARSPVWAWSGLGAWRVSLAACADFPLLCVAR